MKKYNNKTLILTAFLIIASISFATEFNNSLIRNISLKQIKKHVHNDPILVKIRDDLGRTPLHIAVAEGRLSLANFFIKSGAVVNATDSLKAFTPLHYACLHSYTKIARFLLARGAFVNSIDSEGNTPLYYASGNGNPELVDILLLHGAKNDMLNQLEQSPLYACLKLGQDKKLFPYSRKLPKFYLKTIKLLSSPTWLVNHADSNGCSPIQNLRKSGLSSRDLEKFYNAMFYEAKKERLDSLD